MELLIVGAGAMGRWFARAMDYNNTSLAFTDVDETAAHTAAVELGARAVPVDTDEQFSVVCFAVPLSVVEESITTYAHLAEQAVLDVSGVMASPLQVMAEHAPELERMSLHPLFAPENAPGNVAVVSDAPGPTTDAILDRLSDDGNTLVETTPAKHDELMGTVQAKAHAAILAFALASDDVPEGFSTPVFDALRELVEQITGGTPQVYAEIQDAFDGAQEVAEAAQRVADADSSDFERLYREAGEHQ